MPSLLGIDNGLTVTKAVLFDMDGTVLAVARRRVPQSMPEARFVERDMDGLWRATAEAIAEAVSLSGRPASDIAAVAATAHGDGLYLLDQDGKPLGPGILSLDSRAGDIIADWERDGVADRALSLTGQTPHLSAPSALLAWISRHQPERYHRIGAVLGCKDWLTFCLTGHVGTDRTEASTAFTDVQTQDYSLAAAELYGLERIFDRLAPSAHSAAVIGHVSDEAARATGLAAGTPVAAGLHDVTASALGIGAHKSGVMGVVAGTYSINEIVTDKPLTDPRWFCRNAIEPGQWNAMSISPASAANYDWFLDTLCQGDHDKANDGGPPIHQAVASEIDAAIARPSSLLFHPYLFGSPHGGASSGSFVGLHGWHERGDMLKAVLEGIAFNHREHVDALGDGFSYNQVRLTGGVSRNSSFAQMFADILDRPVTVTATEEAAAWGAALCAGAAVGLYAGPTDDPRDLDAISRTFRPDAKRAAAYDRRFAVYRRISEALKPHWQALEALGDRERGQ
ncbi:FGGY-family carbohydrate kinase [Martelella soudanensis]|uniref:FGGY-family carbohydrate kinase n=1 Tax=unclassified Martelella TaxID=2629616 RepID=UPI0015DDC3CD|nr:MULTISPECIES: FGGY-family carbohydrate kinase [unclassified Martelella]